MKRVLIFSGLLLCSSAVVAQHQFGVQVGINQANLMPVNTNELVATPYAGWDFDDDYKSKTTFQIGVFKRIELNNPFSLEFGLDYTTMILNEQTTSTSLSEKNESIVIKYEI